MSYQRHPQLATPRDETILWRYLDLARILDMLERRVLWFARADEFEDPLEGSWTDSELKALSSSAEFLSHSEINPAAKRLFREAKIMRESTFVSCWHAGAHESMAMWDLYRRGGSVLAVKSTVGRLKKALADFDRPVFIGRVKYIDWKDAPWDNNLLAMCVRKELAYRHESEVRAMIWDSDYYGSALTLANAEDAASRNVLAGFCKETPVRPEPKLDPQQLITEVMVGPREKRWVLALVERIMKRYELQQQVIPSRLLQPRF
jgi:hypothetical protein